MVRNNKVKSAFTVVEVLLTMSILSFMLLMIITNAAKQTPDLAKARYKKAYLTVEQTVAKLIEDDGLYPDAFLGFKYTETSITEFGEVIGENSAAKFRDAFKFELDPIEDGINCECLGGTCEGDCFKTDEGIVYGIPNTDFQNAGVKTNKYSIYKNGKTTSEKFVPITIYTDFEKSEKNKTQGKDALYVGVKYDGEVRIFCDKGDCKNPIEKDYLMSDSIKKTQRKKGK